LNRYEKNIARLVVLYLCVTALPGASWSAQTISPKYAPRDGVIHIYGAGGPHTALIRAGAVFEKKTGIPVKVVFGPERKWTESAQRNADIIWGTSEQSMTAFLETYREFRSEDVDPIYN
jgi:accessory colonization factor AcfC